MEIGAFLFAVGALLLTPGPTNTLMALAGASVGFGRAVRLVPAEIGAYLLTTVPLALVGTEILTRWPGASSGLKLVAAVWVLFLAVRLWNPATSTEDRRFVTARGIFVTTLLNPKALIFGLVLLPASNTGDLAVHFVVFVAAIAGAALAWAGGGHMLRRDRTSAEPSPLLRRLAAGRLAFVAIGAFAAALPT